MFRNFFYKNLKFVTSTRSTAIRRKIITTTMSILPPNKSPSSSSPSSPAKSLAQLDFEFTFLTQLPIDPINLHYINPNTTKFSLSLEDKMQFIKSKRDKEGSDEEGLKGTGKAGCFSLVMPERMPFPRLVHWSRKVGKVLELDEEGFKEGTVTKVLAGNEILPGTHPWAHCYAGHQFGYFAGRLGDGRAMSLAEIVNSRGERWELQLKGSGETPYSRMGDGFAVVRSSIREYLCSEANEALGIPTTRALSLIKTAQLVHREELEPGAVVARLSPSWLRLGSFEWFRMTKDPEGLQCLADYAIRHHFPNLEKKPEGSIYASFFSEVAARTGKLFALWQSYGFCHGVLNTDNISILGLTLDYGPFGFMDKFDPAWTPNLSDGEGRYAYDQQPGVGAWNVSKFGLALQPLISPDHEILDLAPGMGQEFEDYPIEVLEGVKDYWTSFRSTYTDLMRQKLGLDIWLNDDPELLLNPLLNLLEVDEVDYTRFFRFLSLKADSLKVDPTATVKEIINQLRPGEYSLSYKNTEIDIDKWIEWFDYYGSRLSKNTSNLPSTIMLKVNPRFVLRNWIAQEAIDAIQKPVQDDDSFQAIFDLVTEYSFSEDTDIDWEGKDYLTKEMVSRYSGPVPSHSQSVRCSCSS